MQKGAAGAAALLPQPGKNCENKLMAIDNQAGKMVNW
jgi:hypothetical protein